MRMLLTVVLVIFFSGSLFQLAEASVSTTGEFIAKRDCPAYLSKNRRTNPGAIVIIPGERYPIVELNRPERADWVRLRISGAEPAQRWVSINCGEMHYAPVNSDSGCATPGLADSYILALSWQPAFCESHRQKTECQREEDDALTLHGLWPNRATCGKRYGYCGPVSRDQAPDNPCDYPPLPLNPTVREALNREMPSARHATCLQRHQWYKHGSCQQRWSPDRYFSRALQLLRQIETSAVGRFLKDHAGEWVATSQFLKRFDQTFGASAHQRLTLLCENSNLTEIYLRLPGELGEKRPLGALLNDARSDFNNHCGSRFFIDDTGPGARH